MGDGEFVTSPRSVTLLGSTGAIRTQTVDVFERNGGRFGVVGLATDARHSGTSSPFEVWARAQEGDDVE